MSIVLKHEAVLLLHYVLAYRLVWHSTAEQDSMCADHGSLRLLFKWGQRQQPLVTD